MAREYTKIHRLLRVYTLLQASRSKGCSAKALGEACHVTLRTVYRDIQALRAAGIPVQDDPETSRFFIRCGFQMPPLQFTAEEALALATLVPLVADGNTLPDREVASHALAKIRAALPPAIGRQLASLEGRVRVRPAPGDDPEQYQDIYALVQQAIQAGRALSCHYASRRGQSAPEQSRSFIFLPYDLFQARLGWYVVGFHCGHEQLRMLKLVRFESVALTEQRYTIPAAFSIQKYLGAAWSMIPGAALHDIELRFDMAFADGVAETTWHASQQTQWNEDGTVTLRRSPPPPALLSLRQGRRRLCCGTQPRTPCGVRSRSHCTVLLLACDRSLRRAGEQVQEDLSEPGLKWSVPTRPRREGNSAFAGRRHRGAPSASMPLSEVLGPAAYPARARSPRPTSCIARHAPRPPPDRVRTERFLQQKQSPPCPLRRDRGQEDVAHSGISDPGRPVRSVARAMPRAGAVRRPSMASNLQHEAARTGSGEHPLAQTSGTPREAESRAVHLGPHR